MDCRRYTQVTQAMLRPCNSIWDNGTVQETSGWVLLRGAQWKQEGLYGIAMNAEAVNQLFRVPTAIR